VSLYSRNHKSFNDKYASITQALASFGHDVVLDGEIVALDEQGRSQFQLLQRYQQAGKGALVYYVFDLLYLDGEDLRALPLRRRKEMLAPLLKRLPNIRISDHVEQTGIAFYQAAVERDLEGIVAKNGDSPYREGVRSEQWLKIKTRKRQEAVIAGFTEPRGSRTGLGALVVGVHEGRDLVYVGHVGGGFDTRTLTDMRARLDPLVQRACPFKVKPKTNAPVHWVKPKLVCEIVFLEWTDDGTMRQPIFLGLREDMPASAVRREVPKSVPEVLEKTTNRGRGRYCDPGVPPSSGSHNRGRSTDPGHKDQLPPGRFTNLGKVYWPDEGYTKGDLLHYYHAIAPAILPHLRDRPLSLLRHPDGIRGASFFQKHVAAEAIRGAPHGLRTATLPSDSVRKEITYIVGSDESTLLYLANLGCIEMNPWHSRLGSLDRPDYAVLDLDRQEIPFSAAVEVAQAIRKLLDSAGAASFCKTSGKRGLHVCIPLAARYDYDQARQFAEIIAALVHAKLPALTSMVRPPAQRRHKVYLDFLQNGEGKTITAPYSVRPVPGAAVSTPLRWSEVTKRLDPLHFTMATLPKRFDKVGDLWQPVLGPGIDLPDCLERLARKMRRQIPCSDSQSKARRSG
jgi:bifunctional non-homologous end joining protein LigD